MLKTHVLGRVLFGVPSLFAQIRPVHTTEGRNWLVLSRRYRCSNPGCEAVQAAVKKAMATTKRGESNIYVGKGNSKRPISDAERAAMRRGELENISATAIRNVIGGGGVSFEINNSR